MAGYIIHASWVMYTILTAPVHACFKICCYGKFPTIVFHCWACVVCYLAIECVELILVFQYTNRNLHQYGVMYLCEDIYIVRVIPCKDGILINLNHPHVKGINNCRLWDHAVGGLKQVLTPKIHKTNLTTETINQGTFLL